MLWCSSLLLKTDYNFKITLDIRWKLRDSLQVNSISNPIVMSKMPAMIIIRLASGVNHLFDLLF